MTRLHLRPVTPADMPEFTEAARASVGFHEPWAFLPVDAEEFERYLKRFDGVTGHGFVLRLAEGGALVGYVNVTQIIRGSYQKATLGYGVFVGHERQGHMTEGLRKAVEHAFGVLGLHRLEAEIQPGNEASRRVVRRLGFTCEGLAKGLIKINGEWRDHERWSITDV